jgi:catechol 2,3-dioxygenase-like lactoylglutathione lyase family enzyme
MAMLDHISLRVVDFERAKAFYTAILAPLGYGLVMEFGTGAGFGPKGKPAFWITKADTAQPTHIAFTSPSREAVRQFYAAALAAGAKDNGAPGLRAEYHPSYYGAFVLDPDGHNIEAVIHTPE